MSNASTRRSSTHNPASLIEVAAPGDFGSPVLAPDGVMRVKVVNGAAYQLSQTMVIPKFWLPKVAAPGTGSIIAFLGLGTVSMLVNGSDVPQFWGRDIASIAFFQISFVDISNFGAGGGSVLFDLVGGDGPNSFLAVSQSAIAGFNRIANIVDVAVQASAQTQDIANSEGWTVRSTSVGVSHAFSNRRFIGIPAPAPPSRAPAITVLGATAAVSIVGNNVQLGQSGSSFLHIDSGSAVGSYAVNGQNYVGVSQGEFFRPDISALAITQQADASIAVSSFADSAVAPGVDTTVNFAGFIDIIRGQAVLIDGGTYAGAYTVVRVADDQTSFDITIAFAGASAGTLALTEHTVASTPFVRDETVTISGTTNYNGTVSLVHITDTTFTTPQVFAGDDATGTAASSGRDQTSLGVLATANGAQESSKVSGEACWNGNASTTSIQDGAAAGVYVPLVLTGVGFGGQRMTLSGAASGELTYNGESPATLTYTVNIEGVKPAGGTDAYRIAESINGVLPVFDAEPAFSSLVLRVASVGVRTLLIRTVPVNPGDTIQPVIIGDGTTTSVIVTEGQILVSV